MSITCVVAAVDRSTWAQRGTLSITRGLGHAGMSLLFQDAAAGGYRPEADQEIVISKDAVPIFGGIVLEPDEGGPGQLAQVQIDATGYAVQATWCRITWTQAAGMSLRDAIDYVIANYMGRYGWTRDPAMAAGPALPKLEFTRVPANEVLDELAALAGGLVWDVAPDKVLTMVAPGATAAPWDIVDGDGHVLAQPEPRVRKSRQEYADRVILLCGGGQAAASQTWIADGLPHGGETTYVTDYPSANLAAPWPNLVFLDDVPIPCSSDPAHYPDYFKWYWDWQTHTLHHHDSEGITPAGTEVRINYTIQFPFEAISDAGSPTPREAYLERTDITDKATGEALALYYRTLLSTTRREVEYSTRQNGLRPGMSQSVQIAKLGINAAYLLTEIATEQIGPDLLQYHVRATEGAAYFGSVLDGWRALAGGSKTGSATAVGGGLVVPAGGRRYADLGGSISRRVTATGWQPVPDCKPKVLYASDYVDGEALVHVWRATENAGDPIQARVTAWNGSAWTQVGIGAGYAGTDVQAAAAHEVFLVTVLDGAQHRLEVNHANATYGVWAHGYVE